MNTLNTWATGLALSLLIAAAGGLMDGPSELDAMHAVATDAQDAINLVATSPYQARANPRFCHQPPPTSHPLDADLPCSTQTPRTITGPRTHIAQATL